MKETALKWAQAGFNVFPLTPGAKTPLPGSRGFKEGSSDPDVVSKMRWDVGGQACNLGVETGRNGLIVLDLDCKNGKDGFASLEAAGVPRELLDQTFTVLTPGNGLHAYFRSSTPVKSGVDVFGKGSGVDLRGEGGYVVAPPSQINGRFYRRSHEDGTDEVPILSELADWATIAPFIPEKPEASQGQPFTPPPEGSFGPTPTPEVIERARRYLSKCPPAIAGQSGHNTTFKMASALVNGFRLDVVTALELLREWNQRCTPPWSDPELRHKVWDAAFRGPPPGKPMGWLLDAAPPESVVPTIEEGEDPKNDETWESDTDNDAFPYPPGYVGMTALWLELHSEKPFRNFAILTALAIWSTLIGRKVRFENQAPIFYSLMVTSTSNGKDSSIGLAREVLEEIGLAAGHLTGRLSSWNAGVEKLQDVWHHPVILSLVDEASGYFAGAASKSDFGLPDLLKAAWSRGLGTLDPQSRVRRSGSTRLRPIHHPSFSMLLGAQPSSLANAIRTDQLEDGLLPRILWAVRRQFDPMVHEENLRCSRRMADSPGGAALLNRARQLWNWLEGEDRVFLNMNDLEAKPEQSDGDDDEGLRREVWAEPVEFTDEPEARVVFHEFMVRTQSLIQPAAEGKEGPYGLFWGKAAELAKRLALIIAAARCGAGEGPYTITEAEAKWAVAFVEARVLDAITWTKYHMADSPFQRMVNRVLDIIRAGKTAGIGRRDLNRRLRHSYPPAKVDEALLALQESGTVYVETVSTRGASKTVYRIARRRKSP